MLKAKWVPNQERVGWRYVKAAELTVSREDYPKAKSVEGEWFECGEWLLLKHPDNRPHELWVEAFPVYGDTVVFEEA